MSRAVLLVAFVTLMTSRSAQAQIISNPVMTRGTVYRTTAYYPPVMQSVAKPVTACPAPAPAVCYRPAPIQVVQPAPATVTCRVPATMTYRVPVTTTCRVPTTTTYRVPVTTYYAPIAPATRTSYLVAPAPVLPSAPLTGTTMVYRAPIVIGPPAPVTTYRATPVMTYRTPVAPAPVTTYYAPPAAPVSGSVSSNSGCGCGG